MITKQLRRITLGAAAALFLSGTVGTAHASEIHALEPPPRCDDYVYVTPLADPPGEAWSVRIVGVDLPRLVNDTAAIVHLDPQDAFPDKPYDVHVDASHSLNITQGLSGPSADIHVAVTNSTGSYVGCSSVYHMAPPPA